MRLFQYEVTDRQGNEMRGNVQAATSDAARLALSNAGYVVKNIRESGAPSVSPTPRPATTRPVTTPAAVAPIPRKTVAQPVTKPDSTTNASDVVRTRPLSDGKLSLLMSQLAARTHAGGNVALVLEDLSSRARRDDLKQALHEGAECAKRGKSMCDAFDRYPDLFLPDISGTLRAGELGGFLPMAADMIAEQRRSSHQLRISAGFHLWYFVVLLAFAPLLNGIVNGSLRSMEEQNKVDGALPIVGTFVGGLKSQGGTALVQFGLLLLAIFVFYRFWHSLPMRMTRHRVMLLIPGFSKRTQTESMDRFCAVFGMVSRTGLSGHRCFEAAANAVPNLVIRDKMLAVMRNVRENVPMSRTLRDSDALPHEYVDVIENGELAGNLPAAFERVSQECHDEYQRKQSTSRLTVQVLGYAVTAIITLAIMATMYVKLTSGTIRILTE